MLILCSISCWNLFEFLIKNYVKEKIRVIYNCVSWSQCECECEQNIRLYNSSNFLVQIINKMMIYYYWNTDRAMECILQKVILKLETFLLLVDYAISDNFWCSFFATVECIWLAVDRKMLMYQQKLSFWGAINAGNRLQDIEIAWNGINLKAFRPLLFHDLCSSYFENYIFLRSILYTDVSTR